MSNTKNTVDIKPEQYSFFAYHLVQELKIKELNVLFEETPIILTPLLVAYKFGPRSFCFIYNFGSVVFLNLDTSQQTAIINKLQSHLKTFVELNVMDEYFLEIDPREKSRVTFNRLLVDKFDQDKVELMSLILAQSTALDFFEKRVEALFNDLKNMTARIGQKVRRLSSKSILVMIQRIIGIKQDLVVSLRLLEKPEAAWEKKVLDELYEAGISMFELKDRFRDMNEKLKMIQNNLEVLSIFAANRKMIILESAILGLFIIDVILVFWELAFK